MTLNDIRFLNTSDIYGFIFYLAENHNSIGTRIKKIEHLRTFFDFLYKIKTALFKERYQTIRHIINVTICKECNKKRKKHIYKITQIFIIIRVKKNFTSLCQ